MLFCTSTALLGAGLNFCEPLDSGYISVELDFGQLADTGFGDSVAGEEGDGESVVGEG